MLIFDTAYTQEHISVARWRPLYPVDACQPSRLAYKTECSVIYVLANLSVSTACPVLKNEIRLLDLLVTDHSSCSQQDQNALTQLLGQRKGIFHVLISLEKILELNELSVSNFRCRFNSRVLFAL